MIVVADTGPVNYLILSGQIDIARALYEACSNAITSAN